jgi:hypothetical protein
MQRTEEITKIRSVLLYQMYLKREVEVLENLQRLLLRVVAHHTLGLWIDTSVA